MNKTKLAVLMAGIFSLGAAQAASLITFDPDGAGPEGAVQIGAFDWSPDNALAQGASPLPTGTGSKEFTLYTQGALGNFLDVNSNPITGTGLNSDFEITFQSVFNEIGTVPPPLGNVVNANFTLAPSALQPGAVNYFKIFWDDTPDADPSTGEGYGDGVEILNAMVVQNNSTFAIFLDANGNLPVADLDQYNGNDQSGYGTVVGSGGGELVADVTTYNTDFFLTGVSELLVELYFNTSHVTPFRQVEPTGPATATAGIVGQIPNFGGMGTAGYDYVNGLNGTECQFGGYDCDFLFQSDANQSFETIPEPGPLALLGLAALAGFGYRRQNRS